MTIFGALEDNTVSSGASASALASSPSGMVMGCFVTPDLFEWMLIVRGVIVRATIDPDTGIFRSIPPGLDESTDPFSSLLVMLRASGDLIAGAVVKEPSMELPVLPLVVDESVLWGLISEPGPGFTLTTAAFPPMACCAGTADITASPLYKVVATLDRARLGVILARPDDASEYTESRNS